MKNVLNAVARIRHLKEISMQNFAHTLKLGHFSAVNADMYSKPEKKIIKKIKPIYILILINIIIFLKSVES
jgi:hypothetical protein